MVVVVGERRELTSVAGAMPRSSNGDVDVRLVGRVDQAEGGSRAPDSLGAIQRGPLAPIRASLSSSGTTTLPSASLPLTPVLRMARSSPSPSPRRDARAQDLYHHDSGPIDLARIVCRHDEQGYVRTPGRIAGSIGTAACLSAARVRGE